MRPPDAKRSPAGNRRPLTKPLPGDTSIVADPRNSMVARLDALHADLEAHKAELRRIANVTEQLVRLGGGCGGGEHLVHLNVPDGVMVCAQCIRRANRGAS